MTPAAVVFSDTEYPLPMTVHGFRIAILATCLLASLPLAAQQRASLAERVEALERQANAGQGSVALLNQIEQLRSELQSLRGQIEELQRQQEVQAGNARSQYLDLDSRLVRLEGGAPVASPGETVAELPSDTGSAESPPPATIVEPAEAPAPGSASEEQDYLAAFEELKRGDYVAASRAFQAFLATHPGGTYAPNALYWLGESYYVTQNYPMAEQQFRAVIAQYPDHAKTADALLKVGLSQYGQDRYGAAKSTLADVIERYPGTDVARTAQENLRSMRLNGL